MIVGEGNCSAAGERLKNEDLRVVGNYIAQLLPIADERVADEDIDMLPKCSPLIDQIVREARMERLDCRDHFRDSRCLHRDLGEGREEALQMMCELDSWHVRLELLYGWKELARSRRRKPKDFSGRAKARVMLSHHVVCQIQTRMLWSAPFRNASRYDPMDPGCGR